MDADKRMDFVQYAALVQKEKGCCKCKKIAGNSLFLYVLSEFVFESDLEPFGKQRFLSGWNCFWVRLIRACV